ncbi:immunoglobulin-like domain-containing protein [Paenibacillus hexagrammi]|uniref:Ig-like domain-containing protein n=1 Tax=Paenibacillus hexagrammi TaxID=2908839 RepID=A0ABY3SDW4_9BACL|nr:immunoglobulin-like domain-containing protein [Paenibacillus sp. YPD9-1]UJF31381.1 Ig-like domain-containing protein [Paenibacillus sp. YPD9-1]
MKKSFTTLLATVLTFGSVIGAVPGSVSAAETSTDADLILHYDMKDLNGSVVKDQTGHYDGTWVNPQNASWMKTAEAGAISFTGGSTSSYISIPTGVLDNLTDITVSTLVNWSGKNPVEWVYALGQTGASTNYLYFTPKYNSDGTARFGIATNGWRNELSAKAPTLTSNTWKLVTTVLSGSNKTLTTYIDGVQVATGSTGDMTLAQIKDATGLSGFLGKSFYSADPYFGGMISDFQIYKTALSADQISNLEEEAEQKISKMDHLSLDSAADQLTESGLLGTNTDAESIMSNLSLPTQGSYGTTISWTSDKANVISSSGVVNRPAFEDGNQTVTLTAAVTDGTNTVNRTFTFTVIRQSSAEEAVLLDAAGLVVHHIDDVRGNLTLPTSGSNGSVITWKSENPSVITPTGEVTRPANGSGDTTIKLTATITSGAAVLTKAFAAKVKELPASQAYSGYLFGYFTGEGYSNGEQIYFARSQGNDPLHWTELNGGNPAITSDLGEKGLRDPFIMRSPEGDKFYMIATDLKMYGSGDWTRAQTAGSRSIMVWESDDLIHWSNQRMAEVSPPEAGNTWAPEIAYDHSTGEYVVFWASKIYDDAAHSGSSYQRIMYAKTRDFYTFSEPAEYLDYGYSTIDTTMIQNDGKVYRFTKDERNNSTSTPNGKFVFEEAGNSIFDPNFTMVKEGVGKGSISRGEGPTVFKSNTENKWYLFIDEFGGRGYVPFETTDLASGNWTMSSNYELPSRPRHGTVLPVTESEYNLLQSQVPTVETPSADVPVSGISVDQEHVVLEKGSDAQLQAAVQPANAANPSILWSSSNEEVAVVDESGKVTALSEGTARITASTVDGGYIAVSEVQVNEAASTTAGAVLAGPDQVIPGSQFEITYGLSHVDQQVLAEDITVTYDPQQVELVSADTLDESKFVIVDHKAVDAGTERLLGVHFGEAQTSPNANWMKLTFKVKEGAASGSALVRVSGLSTANAEGIEAVLEGAVYSVQVSQIDKSALNALILEAQTKHDAAVEGTHAGEYPAGAKAALQTAITSAQQIVDNAAATQAQVEQAVANLHTALDTFLNSVIQRMPGDSNHDNRVSVGDLAIVAKAYGAVSTDANWNDVKQGDLNGDGKIDVEDLAALARLILAE